MERLVIINGRVIDPASGLDDLYNIYTMGGRIGSVRKAGSDTTGIDLKDKDVRVIDASGLVVMPGLIDLHTHLRDPGYEYKETIETGAEAAKAGGYTTILCMANTMPVNDNESVTRQIVEKGARTGIAVMPIGAVTAGLKGERLTEMAELKAAGCAAFSDDGVTVRDPSVMRRALEYSLVTGSPIVSHAEDEALAKGGVMNYGAVSTRLGLRGVPNAAEDSIVARDIQLCELTGGRLHVAHVSTRGAVALIREAKKRGVRVTAEATPHHLTLTDEAVAGYDTNAKMCPPLRAREDVDALMEGLNDTTLDAIATDHAPHAIIEKDVEFDKAANGIVGLETAFSLVYGLVEAGRLSLSTAVKAMTAGPARVIGIDMGTLRVGAQADITIVDLNREWTVVPEKLKSKSKNTPYAGRTLKGVVVKTIANGKVVHDGGVA